MDSRHLFDIGTAALDGSADPTFATVVAPAPSAAVDTDGLRHGRRRRGDGLVTVDAHQVAAEIMFATERAPARAMRADMGLQAVGIMSGHVGLQVVGPGECYGRQQLDIRSVIKLMCGQPRGQEEHWYFLRGSSRDVSSMPRTDLAWGAGDDDEDNCDMLEGDTVLSAPIYPSP